MPAIDAKDLISHPKLKIVLTSDGVYDLYRFEKCTGARGWARKLYGIALAVLCLGFGVAIWKFPIAPLVIAAPVVLLPYLMAYTFLPKPSMIRCLTIDRNQRQLKLYAGENDAPLAFPFHWVSNLHFEAKWYVKPTDLYMTVTYESQSADLLICRSQDLAIEVGNQIATLIDYVSLDSKQFKVNEQEIDFRGIPRDARQVLIEIIRREMDRRADRA